MQENKIGGKLYRILIDEVNDIWDRLSFWTKASDVEFADGSVLEGKSFGHAMIERSKPYAVDDIAYIEDAPSWCMFKCTQAGTTADTVPTTYQTISSAGTVVTDGTAKFTVYDVRPVTSMSTSNYTIPTTGLVNSKLSNFLCSDGYNGGYVGTNTKYFYFDYDDTTGKYGWNERSDRTRNTFHPFSSGAATITEFSQSGNSTYTAPDSGKLYIYLVAEIDETNWYGSGENPPANYRSTTVTVSRNGVSVASCSATIEDSERGHYHAFNSSITSNPIDVNKNDEFTITIGHGSFGGGDAGRAVFFLV